MSEPTLTISDGRVRAVVLPAIGGGLGRFDVRFDAAKDDGWRPAMRPYAPPTDGTPPAFAAAMNVLVPWSNRISGGGFEFEGRRHDLAPNVEGEPCPLHGDGWLAAWRVEAADEGSVRLAHDGAIGPYRYAATLDYAVADGALTARLTARNVGGATLPYGLGLHPWFVRDAGTSLHAPADATWLEGEGHLPIGRVGLDGPRAHDTRKPAPLPEGWINAGYDGWSGRATLRWADGTGVTIEALPDDVPLDRFVLYSPSATADFVCFEPVTHAIDAPNLPGGALDYGMVALAPGASLSIACRLTPHFGDPT